MKTLLLMLFIGCAGAREPHSLQHQRPPDDPVLEGWQPNYDNPINWGLTAPPDWRTGLVARCRHGDEGACWRAGDYDAVKENCRRGHMMSCRAIPERERELPGGEGRAARCAISDDACGERLAKECAEEFPESCRQLMGALHELGLPLLEQVTRQRAIRLARVGCSRGIMADCSVLYSLKVEPMLVSEQACLHDRTSCDGLGVRLLEAGDRVRGQRVLELACQVSGFPSTCELLARGYLRGELAEPIPGRGTALFEHVCNYARMSSSTALEEIFTYVECLANGRVPDAARRW